MMYGTRSLLWKGTKTKRIFSFFSFFKKTIPILGFLLANREKAGILAELPGLSDLSLPRDCCAIVSKSILSLRFF